LVSDSGLVACRDELTGCPFVVDRAHPWPGHPELEATRYVNSGVLGFGIGCRDAVEQAWSATRDDEFWASHVHPGGLFDNHVLCALIELHNWPIEFVDAVRFNWQGFRDDDGTCIAEVVDGVLVHGPTGTPLHLVHFAGIRNLDRYLGDIPFEIAAFIDRFSVEPLAPAAAMSRARAGSSVTDASDHHRRRAAEVTIRAVVHALDGPFDETVPYVPELDGILSVAYATPPKVGTWNDLICGAAYFDADEYRFLDELAAVLPAGPIVELGAGETSRLFSRHRSVVSIENALGPWVSRAVEAGVEVVIGDLGVVDDQPRLLEAVERVAATPALLFVDSPRGGRARAAFTAVLLSRIRPPHIVMHDARRDLFELAAVVTDVGYRLSMTHDSPRGIVVFTRLGCDNLSLPDRPTVDSTTPIESLLGRVVLGGVERVDDTMAVTVRVSNLGATPWAASGEQPVHISHHVIDPGGAMLEFDGTRSVLPCTLRPNDTVELVHRVSISPQWPSGTFLELDLVCEGVHWFGTHGLDDATITVTIPMSAGPRALSPAEPRNERLRWHG
jgi:hypothetical protein